MRRFGNPHPVGKQSCSLLLRTVRLAKSRTYPRDLRWRERIEQRINLLE